MKSWLFVLGTRPEAIKLAPLIRQFRQRNLPYEVVWTGQHTDLLRQTGFLAEFPRTPSLGLGSPNDPLAYVGTALKRLGAFQKADRLRGVLVQGDTASACSGGRWARWAGLPLAHVEAGLRTFDFADPWPEEAFRVELDEMATWRFAPTPLALKHLLDAGLTGLLTGNTGVDALHQLGVRPTPPQTRLASVLVTLHRRESFGAPLAAIAEGLAAVARAHPRLWFSWPLHPNPEVQRSLAGVDLPDNVLVTAPLRYPEFVEKLALAQAVLTDSGGVIEEAATLGIPCVIARDKTERSEAVSEGRALLAGRTSEGVRLVLSIALKPHALETTPGLTFGDGHAAERITDTLETA